MEVAQDEMDHGKHQGPRDYVDAMDRLATPRRPHVRRGAPQEPWEDTDSHEIHDRLTPEEECECTAFRDGNIVECACTQKIREEEEAEQCAQLDS
jgi:hypothetical protein